MFLCVCFFGVWGDFRDLFVGSQWGCLFVGLVGKLNTLMSVQIYCQKTFSWDVGPCRRFKCLELVTTGLGMYG